MSKSDTIIESPDDWRRAIRRALRDSGTSVYRIAIDARDNGICAAKTAERSLASEDATYTTEPSLSNAIALTVLSGCELVVRRRKEARR